MGELHDRMPVILLEKDWAKWLGEEPATEEELMALLKPCPDDVLKIWRVGSQPRPLRQTFVASVAVIGVMIERSYPLPHDTVIVAVVDHAAHFIGR